MANPAARALLADKQTEVIINVLPPCAIEVRAQFPRKRASVVVVVVVAAVTACTKPVWHAVPLSFIVQSISYKNHYKQ